MAVTKISIQKIIMRKNGRARKMTTAFIYCEVCNNWVKNGWRTPLFILRLEGSEEPQHWDLGKVVDRAVQHAFLAHNIRTANQPEPDSISF